VTSNGPKSYKKLLALNILTAANCIGFGDKIYDIFYLNTIVFELYIDKIGHNK
jgi:hypothetical protein